MSECQTESHKVRPVTSETVIEYFSVSSKHGLSVFFFTFVFLFPVLLRSGRRYTFTYLRVHTGMNDVLRMEEKGEEERREKKGEEEKERV